MRRVFGSATALAFLLVTGCSDKKPAAPAPPVAVKGDMELLVEQGQKDLKDFQTWFHIAELYERAQQYPQELDALQKVVAAKPDMGYAHYKMANTYNRLGKREEAVKAFLEAKKLLPNLSVLYNNLGWTYGQLGRPKDQVAALRQAVSLNDHYSTARLSLGLVLLKQGDRKGAQEQYTALMTFDEGAAAELKRQLEEKKP
jgi:tetratricopeptide (TPR) repeat protein